MSEQHTITIPVMGMVRDFLVDYVNLDHAPAKAWAGSDPTNSKQGRKVTVTQAEAKEMATFLMAARAWAMEAGSFANPQRKNNAMRHALRIAKEFGDFAGIEIEAPTRAKKGKQTADETVDLPTEPVNDLEPGDRVIVVRKVTRYGLNTIDRYEGTIQGKTKKGEYWVADPDGANRACRPTEVIVVSRAKDEPAVEPKKARVSKPKAEGTIAKVVEPKAKSGVTPRPKAKHTKVASA